MSSLVQGNFKDRQGIIAKLLSEVQGDKHNTKIHIAKK